MAAKVPQDVQEAFHRVVHDFDVQRLASLMGISPGVLWNKANLNETGGRHIPTLADCILITNLTGDKRIVQAFAAAVGGAYFEFPDLSNLTTDALMVHILKIAHENGDFHRAIERATEKDGISKDEYAEIYREGHELIAAILECLTRMKEMSDAR